MEWKKFDSVASFLSKSKSASRWRLTEALVESSVQIIQIYRVPTVRRRTPFPENPGEPSKAQMVLKKISEKEPMCPNFNLQITAVTA